MKKARNTFTRGFEGMRSHYDFTGGVRGKHAKAYAEGTNRISLAPDVAKVFPDEQSANDALRALIPIVQAAKSKRRKAS